MSKVFLLLLCFVGVIFSTPSGYSDGTNPHGTNCGGLTEILNGPAVYSKREARSKFPNTLGGKKMKQGPKNPKGFQNTDKFRISCSIKCSNDCFISSYIISLSQDQKQFLQ